MAKKKAEETINLDSILFKCRDILRAARNAGSFFEKRDMMLALVFLRFIGEKFEDGTAKLRKDLIAQGLDPDDPEIFAAFFDDATFTDGTYNLPLEARWSTIINTPAPQLNVALDTALHSIAASSKQLRGCLWREHLLLATLRRMTSRKSLMRSTRSATRHSARKKTSLAVYTNIFSRSLLSMPQRKKASFTRLTMLFS